MLQFGFDWKDYKARVQKNLPGSLQNSAAVFGALLIGTLVVVAGVGIALGAYVNPVFLARLRGSEIAAGAAAARKSSSEVLHAEGEIVPLHELGVVAPFEGIVQTIAIKNGQAALKDALLLTLINPDAEAAVMNAEGELAKAKADAASASAPLAQAPDADALNAAYDFGFTAISDAFVFMPRVMQEQESVLYGDDVSPTHTQQNIYYYYDAVKNSFPDAERYLNAADRDYKTAQLEFAKARPMYAAARRNSPQGDIEALMDATYAALKAIAQTLKSTNAFLSFTDESYKNQKRDVPESLTVAEGRTTDASHAINDSLTANLNAITALKNAQEPKTAAPNASEESAVSERIQSAERVVAAARANAKGRSITSPVSGKIARVHVSEGSEVKGGQLLVTIISAESVARVSLPDIFAVHIGQKARVAIDGARSFDGSVVGIDPNEKAAYIGLGGAPARLGSPVSVEIVPR